MGRLSPNIFEQFLVRLTIHDSCSKPMVRKWLFSYATRPLPKLQSGSLTGSATFANNQRRFRISQTRRTLNVIISFGSRREARTQSPIRCSVPAPPCLKELHRKSKGVGVPARWYFLGFKIQSNQRVRIFPEIHLGQGLLVSLTCGALASLGTEKPATPLDGGNHTLP